MEKSVQLSIRRDGPEGELLRVVELKENQAIAVGPLGNLLYIHIDQVNEPNDAN